MRSALALAALTLVYVSFDLGDHGRRAAEQLGWSAVLVATLLHIPLFVVQLVPMGLLVGGTLALAALRQRGELEALQQAGCRPVQLGVPLVVLGALAGAGMMTLGELAVPACERRADAVYGQRRGSQLTGQLDRPSWYRLPHGWFVRWAPDRASISKKGTFPERSRGGQLLALQVDTGFRLRRRLTGQAEAGAERLRDARAYRFAAHGFFRSNPADGPRLLRAARSLADSGARPEALPASALRRRLRHAAEAGRSRQIDGLVLQLKLAYPGYALVVALLLWAGLYASFRRPLLVALGEATVGLVALWLLLAAGWLLGRGGALTPAAAAWGPLIVAASAAATLLAARWPRRLGLRAGRR